MPDDEILLPKALEPVARLCGCGDNHWLVVLKILEVAADEDRSFYDDGFYSNEFKQFCLKFVDMLGLLEHGTGICGSWITDEGMAVLEWLREHGDRVFDNPPPYYVDSEGTVVN